MNIEKIPLSALAKASCNVRVSTADAGVKDLAASIKAHGLLQPLLVMAPDGPQGGSYEVVDGARRLAALKKVHGKKDVEVPVIFTRSRDERDLREASLAANVMRVALHPVDEYEAYARLAMEGLTEPKIADRFGVDPTEVKKRLRLGRLTYEVRDAWRAGKIDAAEARAFAASSDLDRQREVLARILKIKNSWDRGEHRIRRELKEAMVRPSGGPVIFIGGIEAYVAAGGEVEEDLFEGVTWLKDRALVDRLAREKLEAECRRQVGEGWAWAKLYDDVENAYLLPGPDLAAHATAEEKKALASNKWQIERETQKSIRERLCADPGFRATAGVLLRIDHDGTIDVRGPYLSDAPAEKEPEADLDDDEHDDQDEAPAEPKAPEAPHPTRLALSEALTAALASCLAQNPHVALAALTAHLRIRLGHYESGPLRLEPDHRRQGPHDYSQDKGDWSKAFDELDKGPVDKLMAEMALHVATLLDLRELKFDDRVPRGRGWDRQASALALANTMRAEAVNAAIAERFDAAAYFAKIPVPLIDAAVTEMTGKPGKAGKKGDKAAFAAGVAASLRWLPKELRTIHYSGPGSIAWAGAVAQREAAE